MQEQLRSLLGRLLTTHSPSGEEGEMDRLCMELLRERCENVWADVNGNIVAKIPGQQSDDAVLLMAHKDEIGTIVRKIDEDGKIWLDQLGGCVPWVYGEGPFDVIGDDIITGILSVGSRHSSHLSKDINDAKSKALTWEMCHVDCKLTREELAARGIRVGSRACVARSRKSPMYIGDAVAGYALDDKAAVAALLLVCDLIKASDRKPAHDVYIGITGAEETGIMGGTYLARTIPASTHIALEVAPVAPEYDIKMSAQPVVFFKDALFILHKGLAEQLCAISDEFCGGHQRMVVRSFGSDASVAYKAGFTGRAACVGFPTQNTHGFEMGHLGAMENCAKLLAEFALRTAAGN